MGSDRLISGRVFCAICFVAFGLLVPVVSFAASLSNSTVTIDRAVELARQYNPDLAAVARELIIAHGELTKASYLIPFNPEIASEGNWRPRTNQSNTQDWRVALSQQIEIFGQRALRIKAASLNLRERRLMVEDRLRLLSAAVRMTFLDACRLRDQEKLMRELEALDSRLLDAARSRLRAGEIGQIDFNLAQVRYGESQRAVVEARERYRLQRSSLGRLLGGAAGPEPVPAKVQLVLPDYNLNQLIANAMKNRPDLRAREIEVARLETQLTLNSRLALPNIKVGAFGGHELNTEYPMGAMVGFSIPLFNRRQGEAEMITGQIARARDSLRAARLDVEKQVRDAYRAYQAARRSFRIYQGEVIQPADESFNLLEQAFLAGKIDLLRLAVAEREAFRARVRYLDAWFGANAARVSIELATGAS
jgi:cobalt-zinc-cadmium efflux system outer membrane protein